MNYQVEGNGPFCVTEGRGKARGIIYDLIESRKEAETICAILNDGIGPEWDAVEPEFLRRQATENL